MTAATPSLAALHAAACGEPPDPLACLALADLAEEAGDDARAEAWRWLAGPPAAGWERRAWGLLRPGRHYDVRDADGRYVYVTVLPVGGPPGDGRGAGLRAQVRHGRYEWAGDGVSQRLCWRREDDRGRWRYFGIHAPPEVRAAVLSACRAALAGCHR